MKNDRVNGFILGLLVVVILCCPPVNHNGHLVARMKYASDIHRTYLELPEGSKTGSWAWHTEWMVTYDQVIVALGGGK